MKKSTIGIILAALGLIFGYGSIFINRVFEFTRGELITFSIVTFIAMVGCIVGGLVLITNDKP